jgi:hypothetical protein
VVLVQEAALLQNNNLDSFFNEKGEKVWRKALEKLVLFAYYWAMGSVVEFESMPRFERFLSEIFPADILNVKIGNCFFSFSAASNQQ